MGEVVFDGRLGKTRAPIDLEACTVSADEPERLSLPQWNYDGVQGLRG